MVGRDAEAGIFGGQAVERDAHAFLVGLGLGFDRQFDDRFGEFHPFEDDRRVGGAERVPGGGFLEPGEGHDIACKGFVDVRSEEHTSELQSLMRTSYAVFCLKKKKNKITYETK